MARLIDADSLLDTLKFLANRSYNRKLTTSYSNAYKECMEFVRHAPTIEPTLQHVESDGEDGSALKHGHWKYDNQYHWYRACCSECGYYRVTDIKADRWNEWKYCPNCGAKMDETVVTYYADNKPALIDADKCPVCDGLGVNESDELLDICRQEWNYCPICGRFIGDEVKDGKRDNS